MTWTVSSLIHLFVLAIIFLSNWCLWRAMKIQDRMKKEQGR